MFDEFLKENDKNSVEAIKMQVSTNYSYLNLRSKPENTVYLFLSLFHAVLYNFLIFLISIVLKLKLN